MIKKVAHIKVTNGSITTPCKNWYSSITAKDVDNMAQKNSLMGIRGTSNVMGTAWLDPDITMVDCLDAREQGNARAEKALAYLVKIIGRN